MIPRDTASSCRRTAIFKSVVEKSANPPSNLANAGIYLFERSIFDALRAVPLSERGEYELTDGLNLLAAREKIRIVDAQELAGDRQALGYPGRQ